MKDGSRNKQASKQASGVGDENDGSLDELEMVWWRRRRRDIDYRCVCSRDSRDLLND